MGEINTPSPLTGEGRGEGGQFIDGVWLPPHETHLIEIMAKGKDRRVVENKITYQYRKLEACLKHLDNGRRGVALDIGAHVGLWSMWLVKIFEQVEAFEPVPLHRELFRRNLSGSSENWALYWVALGEREGKVDITVPVEVTGNSHVSVAGPHPGTRGVAHPERIETIRDVRLRRLDDFGFERVDFIKIDVEGLERAVVAGGEHTIRRWRPLMIVEQKGNEGPYGDKPNAATELLGRWGMKPLEVISGDWIMGW